MGSDKTIIKIGPKRSVSGKSKKGSQHIHNAEKYRRQKTRTSKNKEKAWKKHLSNHPNDIKAKENLKKKLI